MEKKHLPLNGYTFIDLFCGIGGFHQAIRSFGAKCVFASDIDNKCRKIYENNYGIKPVGDITKVKICDIPNHDILCAGFPCQSFSICGTKKGFNDKKGQLFYQIIRIAKSKKPKLLFLENVKNIYTHDNGNTIKTIIKLLNEIEYKVKIKCLNSANFGCGQSRKRTYFICWNNKIECKDFEFPTSNGKKVYLKDIINYEVKEKIPLSKLKNLNYRDTNTDLKLKPLLIGTINKGRQGERIYSINGVSTTITASGGGIGSKTGLYNINNNIRKLVPDECRKLFGFPSSFKYDNNKNIAIKQFGNSITVPVLTSILDNLIIFLKKSDKESDKEVEEAQQKMKKLSIKK
jgi:DNA (cytosine-5)-methyltransferase 1